MKLFFVALFTISSFFSKANPVLDEPISPAVLHSFQHSFSNAKEINWQVSKDFYQVSFQMNGKYATAFYRVDGQLIGVSRSLLSTDLPFLLQANLKKYFTGYWISELIEVSSEEGVSYYVTLENADNQIVLQSVSQTEWQVYQKKAKP